MHTEQSLTLHQMVYAALFLAVIAIILGGLGTKAYYDLVHNPYEDQEVGNMTVNSDLIVKEDTYLKGDLTVYDKIHHGNYGDEKVTGATKLFAPGAKMTLPDGSVFRYAFSNGALPAGQLVQESAGIGFHDMDLAVTAAAIGSKAITVTPGATAVTLNQYQGGYMYVNDGANVGEGQVYSIASHPAASASTAFVVTLEDGITQTFDANTLVGLKANAYFDCIPAPATLTARILGAPRADIADNRWGWIQTWGEASLLVGAVVPIVGEEIFVSTNTAGAIENLIGADIQSGTRIEGVAFTGMATGDSNVTTTRIMVSDGGTGVADLSTRTAAALDGNPETAKSIILSFLQTDLAFLPQVGDTISLDVEGTSSASGADATALASVTGVVTGIADGALNGGITGAANYHISLSACATESDPAAVNSAATFTLISLRMIRPAAQRVGIALHIPAVATDYQLCYIQISP